jgi:hypothetical protein
MMGAHHVPGGGAVGAPLKLCQTCHERRVSCVFSICGHKDICSTCRTRLLVTNLARVQDRLPNSAPRQYRRINCPHAFCDGAHLEEQVYLMRDWKLVVRWLFKFSLSEMNYENLLLEKWSDKCTITFNCVWACISSVIRTAGRPLAELPSRVHFLIDPLPVDRRKMFACILKVTQGFLLPLSFPLALSIMQNI